MKRQNGNYILFNDIDSPLPGGLNFRNTNCRSSRAEQTHVTCSVRDFGEITRDVSPVVCVLTKILLQQYIS